MRANRTSSTKGGSGKRSKTAAAPPADDGAAATGLAGTVDALAALLRQHDLNEIEVEEAGRRIYLRRGATEVMAAPSLMAAPPAPGAPPTGAAPPSSSIATSGSKTDTSDGNVSYITSPFVGTFYRSPGPDSAPFVDAGTRFRKGQALCIVEAMKLMNEIEAEIEGTIVQILVENGQAVEYGEPLFKIKQG